MQQDLTFMSFHWMDPGSILQMSLYFFLTFGMLPHWDKT